MRFITSVWLLWRWLFSDGGFATLRSSTLLSLFPLHSYIKEEVKSAKHKNPL